MSRKFKHISKNEFNRLKTLTNTGLSINTIAKATGRAYTTIQKVGASDTFDEYSQTKEKPRVESKKSSENLNEGVYTEETFKGGFQKMHEVRKEKLPKIQDSIQEMLKNYDGGSIAIVMVDEDENGRPAGATTMITGVSSLESQIALSRNLDDACNTLLQAIAGINTKEQ